jgi:hypothetical protein
MASQKGLYGDSLFIRFGASTKACRPNLKWSAETEMFLLMNVVTLSFAR